MIEDAAGMRTMAEFQHEDEGLLTLQNPTKLVRLLWSMAKTSLCFLFLFRLPVPHHGPISSWGYLIPLPLLYA